VTQSPPEHEPDQEPRALLPPMRSWMPPAEAPSAEDVPPEASAEPEQRIVWNRAAPAPAAPPEPPAPIERPTQTRPLARPEPLADAAPTPAPPASDDGWGTPIRYYRAGEGDDPEPEPQTTLTEPAPAAELPPLAPTPPSTPTRPSIPGPDIALSPTPGYVERGQIHRRARYMRALREVQLRDIGGFALELHRFGEHRPELMAAKLRGAALTDTELRSLEQAIDERSTVRELREAGVGGACERCGALHGSNDNYCATCGERLDGYDSDHSE
jgi:hypothetical protein